MNKVLVAFLATLALFLGVPGAFAKVTIVATDSPDAITVGQPVELDFKISVTPSGKPYFGADFTGGFITLFSGDGQKTILTITPGEASESFTVDFTYDTPGNYIPKYSGLVFYSEDFKKFGDDWCKGRDCDKSYDIGKFFTFDLVHGKFNDPGVSEIGLVEVSAAAPELSTWLMMLIGFAAMGLVAYRRPKKVSSALPAS